MTKEELFEKYSIRLSLAYEAGGMGTVKHWDYLMTKEGFLQAIDEAVKNLSSNPLLSDSLPCSDGVHEIDEGSNVCKRCGERYIHGNV